MKRLASLPEDPLYVPVEGPRLPTRREPPEDFEKLPDLVKRAVDSAAGVERNAGVVNLAYVEVEYEDSTGRGGQYAVNRVYMAMRSFLGELSATAAAAGRRIADIKAEKLGEENSQILSLAKGLPQRRVEPTKADLLLSPLVFGHLVGELMHFWTNGSEVVANSSRYTKEDVGRQVASELLTVVEKTYDESAHGYAPFDFEGTPPRPVEVYRRGVLSGFIHTRRTAPRPGNGAHGPRPLRLGQSCAGPRGGRAGRRAGRPRSAAGRPPQRLLHTQQLVHPVPKREDWTVLYSGPRRGA